MTRTRPNPLRVALRFVASVLMVSGTLLIVDAALTLLWQEPVSAFTANHQQNRLRHSLEQPPPRVIKRKPLKGDAIARLRIPAIGIDAYVVQGTDTASLRKGPGHYPSTPLPGRGGTVAIAGHRTTYGAPFRHLDRLRRGQRITLDAPFGRFVYRVQGTRVVDDSDLSVLKRRGYERLVLTACHPLYSAAQRIVGFARLERKLAPRVKRRS